MEIKIVQEPQADGADKYEKDYYVMGIIAIKDGEENELDECLISKDGKEILWMDAENEKYLTVAQWRKKIQSAPYWELN
jgi:hypothetical protein